MLTKQHHLGRGPRRAAPECSLCCLPFCAFCFLFLAFCLLASWPALAQQPQAAQNTGTIRLPEVVITGVDRSKVQRTVTKVAPFSEMFVAAEAVRDRSDALLHQGDGAYAAQPQQAEQLYLQAITSDPGNSTAYLRSGDAARIQGKYAEAARAYQQALTLNPKLLEAHYQAGILYESHLQDLNAALGHFRAYLDGGGTDPRVNIWLRETERKISGQEGAVQ